MVWSLSSASQLAGLGHILCFYLWSLYKKESPILHNISIMKKKLSTQLLSAAVHWNIVCLAWCLYNFYLQLNYWVLKEGSKEEEKQGERQRKARKVSRERRRKEKGRDEREGRKERERGGRMLYSENGIIFPSWNIMW